MINKNIDHIDTHNEDPNSMKCEIWGSSCLDKMKSLKKNENIPGVKWKKNKNYLLNYVEKYLNIVWLRWRSLILSRDSSFHLWLFLAFLETSHPSLFFEITDWKWKPLSGKCKNFCLAKKTAKCFIIFAHSDHGKFDTSGLFSNIIFWTYKLQKTEPILHI